MIGDDDNHLLTIYTLCMYLFVPVCCRHCLLQKKEKKNNLTKVNGIGQSIFRQRVTEREKIINETFFEQKKS